MEPIPLTHLRYTPSSLQAAAIAVVAVALALGLGQAFGAMAAGAALLWPPLAWVAMQEAIPPPADLVAVDERGLTIGAARWPLSQVAWAEAHRGELCVYDVEGAVLFHHPYRDDGRTERVVELIRAHRPTASEIADSLATRDQMHAARRALLDRS